MVKLDLYFFLFMFPINFKVTFILQANLINLTKFANEISLFLFKQTS